MIGHLALLVETGREADRIRETPPEDIDRQARHRPSAPGVTGIAEQASDRQMVRRLGVERVQHRLARAGKANRSCVKVRKDVVPVGSERERLVPATAESGRGA